MKLHRKSFLLYLVTDRSRLCGKTLEWQVEKAIRGGVTMVQIREKEMPFHDYLKNTLSLKKITGRYNIPLIVNDNIRVAVEADVEGVHIGQDDSDIAEARKLIGSRKILGVSVTSKKQAMEAMKLGADYLGAGAVFSSPTKHDAVPVTLETLKEITSSVSIPVVAIGGICENNIMALSGTGISGVAVISALFSKPDIKAAAGEMLFLSETVSKPMEVTG